MKNCIEEENSDQVNQISQINQIKSQGFYFMEEEDSEIEYESM